MTSSTSRRGAWLARQAAATIVVSVEVPPILEDILGAIESGQTGVRDIQARELDRRLSTVRATLKDAFAPTHWSVAADGLGTTARCALAEAMDRGGDDVAASMEATVRAVSRDVAIEAPSPRDPRGGISFVQHLRWMADVLQSQGLDEALPPGWLTKVRAIGRRDDPSASGDEGRDVG